MNVNRSVQNRFTSTLILIQKSVSIIMISLLVFLVFMQVLLRAFGLPLMGIEELIVLPTIWLYMLGAANASEERSHIVVDIVEVFLKNERVLRVLDVIKNVVSLLIAVILLYWMFNFFNYSLQLWKYSPLLSIPMFFIESALFVGVLLMTIYTLSDVIKSFKTFFSTNSRGMV